MSSMGDAMSAAIARRVKALEGDAPKTQEQKQAEAEQRKESHKVAQKKLGFTAKDSDGQG